MKLRIAPQQRGQSVQAALPNLKGDQVFGGQAERAVGLPVAPADAFGDTRGQQALANAAANVGEVLLNVENRRVAILTSSEGSDYRRKKLEFATGVKRIEAALQTNNLSATQMTRDYPEAVASLREGIFGDAEYETIDNESLNKDIDVSVDSWYQALDAGLIEKTRVFEIADNVAGGADSLFENVVISGQNNDIEGLFGSLSALESLLTHDDYLAIKGEKAYDELDKLEAAFITAYVVEQAKTNPDLISQLLDNEELMAKLDPSEQSTLRDDIEKIVLDTKNERTKEYNKRSTELANEMSLGITNGEIPSNDVINNNPELSNADKVKLLNKATGKRSSEFVNRTILGVLNKNIDINEAIKSINKSNILTDGQKIAGLTSLYSELARREVKQAKASVKQEMFDRENSAFENSQGGTYKYSNKAGRKDSELWFNEVIVKQIISIEKSDIVQKDKNEQITNLMARAVVHLGYLPSSIASDNSNTISSAKTNSVKVEGAMLFLKNMEANGIDLKEALEPHAYQKFQILKSVRDVSQTNELMERAKKQTPADKTQITTYLKDIDVDDNRDLIQDYISDKYGTAINVSDRDVNLFEQRYKVALGLYGLENATTARDVVLKELYGDNGTVGVNFYSGLNNLQMDPPPNIPKLRAHYDQFIEDHKLDKSNIYFVKQRIGNGLLRYDLKYIDTSRQVKDKEGNVLTWPEGEDTVGLLKRDLDEIQIVAPRTPAATKRKRVEARAGSIKSSTVIDEENRVVGIENAEQRKRDDERKRDEAIERETRGKNEPTRGFFGQLTNVDDDEDAKTARQKRTDKRKTSRKKPSSGLLGK